MAIFRINNQAHELQHRPDEILADLLRGRLGLTGTKLSCAMGECGACTVLVENRPVLACMTLAERVVDREIVTIEGLERDGELHPLQRSFVENFGMQCGICTPGIIMMATALLEQNPDPTEGDVREAINGNICRCGSYAGIVRSILAAGDPPRVNRPSLIRKAM